MGLVPVQLRLTNLSVGKTDSPRPLQFSPPTAAKLCLQFLPLPNRQVDSDDLDLRQLAEQLEVIHHGALSWLSPRIEVIVDIHLWIIPPRA